MDNPELRKHRSRQTITVAIVAVVIIGLWIFSTLRAPGDTVAYPIPEDATYIESTDSDLFSVRGTVTLEGKASDGYRYVSFVVDVEPFTRLEDVTVTVHLTRALDEYLEPHLLVFGIADAKTVPDDASVLTASCKHPLPDPHDLPDSARQDLYDAITRLLRVGIWWDGGEEFIRLGTDHIDYVGFPDLD